MLWKFGLGLKCASENGDAGALILLIVGMWEVLSKIYVLRRCQLLTLYSIADG